jgi:dTMP kinase
MARGRFISLEGIEGAGKSTLARSLHDTLARRGVDVLLTREPGGTPLAEALRDLVLKRGSETISPAVETLLMFASRGVHLDNAVRPALERGRWVLCDRFTDATYAYQGGGRGVSLQLIDQLAAGVQQGLWPDCTLLLDLPPEEGLARARSRNGATPADRFESERLAFFTRVRAAYLERASLEPRRVHVIDARQDAAQVLAAALAALDPDAG